MIQRCNLADILESGAKIVRIPFLGKRDDEVDTTHCDIYNNAPGNTVKLFFVSFQLYLLTSSIYSFSTKI